MVTVVRPWCRVVLVAEDGTEVTSWVMDGPGPPDLGSVDLLARWQLWARSCGWSMTVRDLCRELEELVELAGLGDQLGLGPHDPGSGTGEPTRPPPS